MPKWTDIANSEAYQNLPLREQQVKKLQFWNDIVTQSPKYKSLGEDLKGKVFQDFFPKGEYLKIMGRELTLGLIREWKNLPGIKQGDVAVNKIADIITGEIKPEGKTLVQFPRFLAGEVVRAYKPSTLLPFLGVIKVVKPILKPVGRFIASKTPERVKKFLLKELTIGKGQPKTYQVAKETAQLEKAIGGREAEQVGKILSTDPKTGAILPPSEQKYIGRIFRKETIESPELLAHPKYQQLKAISDEGRLIMDKWSTELAKSGIPKTQTAKVIEENVGQYMGRMYVNKLKKTNTGFSFKDLRLRLNGLKHRKDLSNEVRLVLGEIKEPALPTAIRVKEISASIANNKLFNTVAKNPEWVANNNITGNMIKMADTPALGVLRNKWVIPSIAEDVNAITVANTQAQSLYLKSLNAWKYGKVVLNPATHVRNMLSNSILLDLSGVNQFRQAQLFPRVVKDYLSKGKLYKLAVENGAIGGEFVGGEIQRLKMFYDAGNGGHLSKLLNTIKMPFRKLGNIYQGEEQLAKMIKFADMVEKGVSPKIAAEEAQKWLFDYTKVPHFIDIVKKSPIGSPFITFTYKSIPRIAEALVDKPLKVYKYYSLFKGWNEASQKTLGMSPEEYARQTKALPPWLFRSIGGIPANLLMPYKDKHDRTQWINLEYILPIGMAPEIIEKGLLKGGISNPFINIIMDLSKNSDFKGQAIIPIGSTNLEAGQKTIEYIYRQLFPSLAPAIPNITKGGYSFEKIISAIYQRPDYAERIRGVTPALLDTLAGIKITPLDVDESEMFNMLKKKSDIEELQKQVLKLQHPAISEKEREKQAEIIFQKMQRILEK